jgi:hypothetical protein
MTRWSECPTSPSQLLIAPWGGAIPRGRDRSPIAGRDAAFVVHPFMLWEEAADDERMIALGRGLRGVMRPYATGDVYLNFAGPEGEDRVRAGFGAANHDRLAAIKAA